MTARQRSLVRHAIGGTSPREELHRNNFCAEVGSDDYKEWLILVDLGYAVLGAVVNDNRSVYFHVTPAGRVAAE